MQEHSLEKTDSEGKQAYVLQNEVARAKAFNEAKRGKDQHIFRILCSPELIECAVTLTGNANADDIDPEILLVRNGLLRNIFIDDVDRLTRYDAFEKTVRIEIRDIRSPIAGPTRC